VLKPPLDCLLPQPKRQGILTSLMARREWTDLKGREALARAFGDPFGTDSRSNVQNWLSLLASRFPLWSFQAWAYAALPQSRLPTNYPLQQMIESIVRDERLKPGERTQLDPLASALDRRRYRLSDKGRYGPPSRVIGTARQNAPYEQFPLRAGPSAFNRVYPLSLPEDFDPDDPKWDGWPYKDVGMELTQLIGAQQSATDTAERRKAREELTAFLKSLGVRLGRGNPGKGPRKDILQLLVDQGTELLTLCWKLLPPKLSAKHERILRDHNVTDLGQQRLWVTCLALPVYSQAEVHLLLARAAKSKTPPAQAHRPTPWNLTVSILAHRLRIEPKTLARKVSGSEASAYPDWADLRIQ